MGAKFSTTEDLLLMAFANYKLQNYEKMLENAQKALEIRKDAALAIHYKALALKCLGDLKGAEKVIQGAINEKDFEEEQCPHVFLLGVIQWNVGDMENAENNLKKAINYAPSETVYLIEYATFLVHRGKFEEALDSIYKARSINPDAPKLNLLLRSAKQKEFLEGIDEFIYEPPLPFNTETAIPYIMLGNYFLKHDFLSNAQIQFAEALRKDKRNKEAQSGYATSFRLGEGGFMMFARQMAGFLTQWYVLICMAVVFAFMGWTAYKEPFFLLPAVSLMAMVTVGILLMYLIGMKRLSSDEYHKILQEWQSSDIDDLVKKLEKYQSEDTKQKLKEEAILSKAENFLGYSSFFTFLFWLSLIIQIILVNIRVTNKMSVEIQDIIYSARYIFMFVLASTMGLAIFTRVRYKSMYREAQEEIQNLKKGSEEAKESPAPVSEYSTRKFERETETRKIEEEVPTTRKFTAEDVRKAPSKPAQEDKAPPTMRFGSADKAPSTMRFGSGEDKAPATMKFGSATSDKAPATMKFGSGDKAPQTMKFSPPTAIGNKTNGIAPKPGVGGSKPLQTVRPAFDKGTTPPRTGPSYNPARQAPQTMRFTGPSSTPPTANGNKDNKK